jgi:hypothetical protein
MENEAGYPKRSGIDSAEEHVIECRTDDRVLRLAVQVLNNLQFINRRADAFNSLVSE